jgi:hypothetical protein
MHCFGDRPTFPAPDGVGRDLDSGTVSEPDAHVGRVGLEPRANGIDGGTVGEPDAHSVSSLDASGRDGAAPDDSCEANGVQFATWDPVGQTPPTGTPCTPSDPGQACFDGEWLWMHDLRRNGLPIGVYWTWTKAGEPTREGIIVHDDGVDGGWVQVAGNVDDDGTIEFYVCDVRMEDRDGVKCIAKQKRCTGKAHAAT